MKQQKNSIAFLTLMLTLIITPLALATGKTIYVDDNAAGTNDGTSWENAYVYLQDALIDADYSGKPVEIRVAAGTYTPRQQTPGDTSNSFELINRVNLFGGYASVSDPNTDPDVRDPVRFETILSGHLGYAWGNPQYCYNVIYPFSFCTYFDFI